MEHKHAQCILAVRNRRDDIFNWPSEKSSHAEFEKKNVELPNENITAEDRKDQSR